MCYPTGSREAPQRDFPKAGMRMLPARRRGVWTAAGFDSPPGFDAEALIRFFKMR